MAKPAGAGGTRAGRYRWCEMKFVLILLSLPFCAPAEDLYRIRQLSEREMLETYTGLLRDACHHADRDWTALSADLAEGYWGNGISGGNEGIRAIGGMVLACGTLLKYDDGLQADDRREFLAKATAALLCCRHAHHRHSEVRRRQTVGCY